MKNNKWSRLITIGLKEGVYDENGVVTHPLLNKLLLFSVNPEEAKKYFINSESNRSPSLGTSDYSDRLFKKIDCHEFSPKDGSVDFVNGQLIFDQENDPCADEAFDRFYDSRELLTTSPIYYLAGSADTAAPYEGARYHFEHQTLARRNFMTLEGGGHTQLGWIFPDCKEKIWETIFAQKNLDQVLNTCRNKVKLEKLIEEK